MLTWRLRKALNDPLVGSLPQQQAYLQLTRQYQRYRQVSSGFTRRSPLTSLFRGVGLSVLPIAVILFGAPIFIVLLFFLFIFSPFLLPLANTIYGLVISLSVSGRIAHEYEKGTYALLCTLPPGIVGLHWAHTVSGMANHRSYRNIALVMVVIAMITAIFGVAALFQGTNTDSHLYWLMGWIVESACVTAIILIDHAAAQVSAGLLSMMIPASVTNVANARFTTAAVFLVLHVGGYVLVVFTWQALLFFVYSFTQVGDHIVALTLPALLLLALGSYRELTVRLLWRRLPVALNATSAELDGLC